ncbi:MAG TPA: acylphosphatase [Candidatus Altiarchaeales archaeon]|nr:acylphosphatase [Candidatus Altiarchaeales archaeon]
MKNRVHVFISGRVQGVFFRASTRDKALELGLTGWVRNLPDDRVEAVFEGEEEKVKEMLKWCNKGPAFASVSDVEYTIEKPTGEFSSFEIRY